MRYVAFLRAINTGSRRIKMEVLRDAFAAAGLPDAATYLATGNVIFDRDDPPDCAALEASLDESLGFDNRVFLRTAGEIEAVLGSVPWDGPGDVEVSFLDREPDPQAARALEATAVPPEALAVVGRDVLFLREGPHTQTTHKESTTERMLETVTTRRGLATVQGIRDRFLS